MNIIVSLKIIILSFLLLFTGTLLLAQSYSTQGELKKWHKITIDFVGPYSEELATPNPFADYRLEVRFTNGNKSYVVPGYFAADGEAHETSKDTGRIWKVHFAPDEIGTWTWESSFYEGTDVAISEDTTTTGLLHGLIDSFYVQPTDKTGKDFRGRGRLKYVGEHYLQFQEDSTWFYKAGADAPENTLAYDDFDDVPNVGGRRKSWNPHAIDFDSSDSLDYTWKNGNGTELMGVINYLSTKNVNALSFLTFSLDGDDDNVFPHRLKLDINGYQNLSNDQRWGVGVYVDRFDVSRMAQWERIFEYADKKGLYLHFKTQETENDQKMDGGDVGRERKLYYRELIARFSHHLALNWNTGEENTQTAQQEIDMADYLNQLDPYNHNIVMHTYPGQYNRYNALIGSQSEYTGASIQTSNATYNELFSVVSDWVENSQLASKKWIVAVDEPGNASIGIDSDPDDIDLVRSKVVWGTMFAGGAGVEFYYGYQSGCGDLNCEDHRSRDLKYTEASYAIEFFDEYLQSYLPIIYNDDALTGNSDDYVLTNGTNMMAVYFTEGTTTTINLDTSSVWELHWYNPRNGVYNSNIDTIVNSITAPDDLDWVALISRDCPPVGTSCNDGNSATSNDTINQLCQCIGFACLPPGTPCDDGNPNSVDDQEDGNCNCAGTLPIQVPGRVEAEDYTEQSGIQTESTDDVGGGENVGFIENGDYMIYQILVDSVGAYNMDFRVASNTNGGSILLEFGDLIDTIEISNTGGWQVWETVSVENNLSIGLFEMKLTFIGGSGYLMNINYVDFSLVNCTVGAPCDDGNPLTTGDFYSGNCVCVGSLIVVNSPQKEAENTGFGNLWTKTSDNMACSNEYLLPPDQTAFDNPPLSTADLVPFVMDIEIAGTYKIYARVATSSDSDDSFWVRANDGVWQKWNKINYPYTSTGFQWSQVGNWTSGNNSIPVDFELVAGINTIYFSYREPGAKLDKILVTQNDLSILNVVYNSDSIGEFSLNYAVAQACPMDTVYFDNSIDHDTIRLGTEDLIIDQQITLIGNGVGATVIDGEGQYRILTNNASLLSIENLEMINGYAEADGGAFLNNTLISLKNISLKNNKEGLSPKSFTNNGEVIIINNSVLEIKE